MRRFQQIEILSLGKKYETLLGTSSSIERRVPIINHPSEVKNRNPLILSKGQNEEDGKG